MSSNRVTDNKFTTSCSRSRDRKSRIQDESGQEVVIPPLLQKERRYRMYRLFLRARCGPSPLAFYQQFFRELLRLADDAVSEYGP